MSEKKSIKANTFYNVIKSVMNIIFPLITFPYISRVLEPENVGKINFGNSIVSYFTLIASLGISTYAVRECSKCRDDKEKLDLIAGQIYSVNVCSTIFSYFMLVLLLLFSEPLSGYRSLICIQSMTILFTTIGTDWINTVFEDFKYITMRTIAMQLASILLMFLFVRDSEDYLIYALVSVIAAGGISIVNIFHRKKFCHIHFTFHMNARTHLKPIVIMFAMLIAQMIYCNSDITMLGILRNDYEVGLYSTSVKIYQLVNTIVASVTWVVVPGITVGLAGKDSDEVNRLLKYAMNYILVLGLPCLVGLNVMAKPIIYFLAGEKYLDASVSLHILSVALCFSFIGGWVGNMILIPSGKEKFCLWSGIASATLNLIVNFFLIPIWGLNGAALTTAMAEGVALSMGIWFAYRSALLKYFDVKKNRIMEMLKAPMIGSGAILVIGFCMSRLDMPALAILFGTIGLSTIVYLGVLVCCKNEFAMDVISDMLLRFHKKKSREHM